MAIAEIKSGDRYNRMPKEFWMDSDSDITSLPIDVSTFSKAYSISGNVYVLRSNKKWVIYQEKMSGGISSSSDQNGIYIVSFSLDKESNEIGSTLTSFNVSWTLNNTPIEQRIKIGQEAEEIIPNDIFSKTYTNQNITADTEVTLTVKGEDGTVVSRVVKIVFLSKVYWGVSSEIIFADSDILSLENSELTNKRDRTINLNAGENEKIVYAIPSFMGTPIFLVGGFEGGFTKSQTLNLSNEFEYSQDYDIWTSVNTGLGDIVIAIK